MVPSFAAQLTKLYRRVNRLSVAMGRDVNRLRLRHPNRF